MKTIAVDFDGVIHRYSAGWYDGSCYDIQVEGALNGLQKLMKSHAVFVFSTRDSFQIQEWFTKHATNIPTQVIADHEKFWNGGMMGNLPVLGITNRKLAAIAYIDDRAIRFTNWADMLAYFT